MQCVAVIYFVLGVLCLSVWLKDKVLAAKSLLSEQTADVTIPKM